MFPAGFIDRQKWLRQRAYELWEKAGHPHGRSLDFWLSAEADYDNSHLCALSPGCCPFQEVKAACGGRHISVCTIELADCRSRAANFNRS